MGRWSRWCALAVWAPHVALAQPVTNGQPALGDPAVGALVDASDRVVCTASVIGAHTAITAAHCVPTNPLTLRMFLGSSIADGGTFLAVSDARKHPGFDPGGRDLAMLSLRDESPVAPLELEPTLDATLVGTSFRAVGFGVTGPGLADSGIKREGTARIAAVRAEELVAVPGPSLSCLGDSGGPALLEAGTIAGVVSRVDTGCGDHAVYTRIDVAREILVDPYLADTAPETAALGEACFYEGHCAVGACVATDADPLKYVCSEDGCGGCASRSGAPGPLVLAIVIVIGRLRARRGRLPKGAP